MDEPQNEELKYPSKTRTSKVATESFILSQHLAC